MLVRQDWKTVAHKDKVPEFTERLAEIGRSVREDVGGLAEKVLEALQKWVGALFVVFNQIDEAIREHQAGPVIKIFRQKRKMTKHSTPGKSFLTRDTTSR